MCSNPDCTVCAKIRRIRTTYSHLPWLVNATYPSRNSLSKAVGENVIIHGSLKTFASYLLRQLTDMDSSQWPVILDERQVVENSFDDEFDKTVYASPWLILITGRYMTPHKRVGPAVAEVVRDRDETRTLKTWMYRDTPMNSRSFEYSTVLEQILTDYLEVDGLPAPTTVYTSLEDLLTSYHRKKGIVYEPAPSVREDPDVEQAGRNTRPRADKKSFSADQEWRKKRRETQAGRPEYVDPSHLNKSLDEILDDSTPSKSDIFGDVPGEELVWGEEDFSSMDFEDLLR